MGRQHQDPDVRQLAADFPGGVQSFGVVVGWHPDIDHSEFRAELADQRDELVGVAGLPDHVEAGALQQADQTFPEQDVVVSYDRPNRSRLRHVVIMCYIPRRGLEADVRGGLFLRVAIGGAVLAVLVATAFGVLLSTTGTLRDLQERARHSEQVLATANLLERLVVDLETGQRGFVITGQADQLQPWQAARTAIPREVRRLQLLVADNPRQRTRLDRIDQAITSYLEDYSVPLVATARRDPAAARTVAVTTEGKRRVDAIRAEFDRFVAAENQLAGLRQAQAEAADRRASAAAAMGLAGSLLLVIGLTGYLTYAIARPVRRAAAMAERIAQGDLDARVPERGPGEVGLLQRSFNSMAGSLQESRAELAASRARIVNAADEERRRIERDLHDGIQQRLVQLVLELRTADPTADDGQLDRIADELTAALDEVRELSRGIHPAILTQGGLGPAIKALGRRSTIPVELELDVPRRLPDPVEVAAYYVASEALANVAKHANATSVRITARADREHLHLEIRDDGIGGATTAHGSGLIGLTDRVETVGGTLSMSSQPGEGTRLIVQLPLQPSATPN
jgi:signal transduction histidine kinase